MTLLISSVFTYDTDAGNYIQAVEAADGQALEAGTRQAINNFVIGCKQDGIWSAIKASCILSGARTLSGALVPLAGTAPTNFNFVSGDYDRKTGLVGNNSNKYLSSNRNTNSDPQNNLHSSIYASIVTASTTSFLGEASPNADKWLRKNNSSTLIFAGVLTRGFSAPSLIGISRNSSSQCFTIANGSIQSHSLASGTPSAINIPVFARSVSGSISEYSNDRLAFYSIGESLDLALLDARVTSLINAFAVAIP